VTLPCRMESQPGNFVKAVQGFLFKSNGRVSHRTGLLAGKQVASLDGELILSGHISGGLGGRSVETNFE
jgi:hypothetical protein